MRRSDILLAIIASANGKALRPVHVQKVAFLVSQRFDSELPENFYVFDKYDYGPFSVDIYNDAEHLEYWGLIQISLTGPRGRKEYTVADHVLMDKLNLPEGMKSYIKKTVLWAQEQSFQELVRSIYLMFPEYRQNSVFQYSEEEALLESFRRGLKQMKEGRVYPARERLKELRRNLECKENADCMV